MHFDTTSISVYGDYRNQVEEDGKAEKEMFKIARGYSKDHRPDLKQLIFGNATIRGLQVYGTVDRGNLDDHTWNHSAIASLAGLVSKEVHGEIVYSEDSAPITTDNLTSDIVRTDQDAVYLSTSFDVLPVREAQASGVGEGERLVRERSGLEKVAFGTAQGVIQL